MIQFIHWFWPAQQKDLPTPILHEAENVGRSKKLHQWGLTKRRGCCIICQRHLEERNAIFASHLGRRTRCNVEHIAEHDLKPEDVEEVLFNPVDHDVSRSSGLPIIFGFTPDGRYILVVYEKIRDFVVYPVTAYDVEE